MSARLASLSRLRSTTFSARAIVRSPTCACSSVIARALPASTSSRALGRDLLRFGFGAGDEVGAHRLGGLHGLRRRCALASVFASATWRWYSASVVAASALSRSASSMDSRMRFGAVVHALLDRRDRRTCQSASEHDDERAAAPDDLVGLGQERVRRLLAVVDRLAVLEQVDAVLGSLVCGRLAARRPTLSWSSRLRSEHDRADASARPASEHDECACACAVLS